MSDPPPKNTTTQSTTTQLPKWAQPYAENVLKRADTLSKIKQNPYEAYPGEQVAPLTSDHYSGLGMVQNRALNGSPLFDAASSGLQNTIGGQYLGHTAGTNPYMGDQPTSTNPYMGMQTSVAQNPMLGLDNPYLNSAIDYAQGDVTRNFQKAIMPQTDANFARAGAFGGSAWREASAENSRQLANELGRVSNDMRMQDYGNQQQLQESAAGRQTNVNLADIARNSGLGESNLARGLQAWQTNAGLADTMLGRNETAYQAERERQMTAAPLAQEFANQPYQDAQMLLSSGDVLRDYQQTLDNQNYQNWLNQKNYPLQQLDILNNAIRTMMGGGGSSITQQQMPQINPAAALFGGGLAGASLGGALGNALGDYGGYGALGGAGLGALAGLLG